MRTSYTSIVPFQTKDGSEIRELMHPAIHGNKMQSLAEAIVSNGQTTRLHRHPKSEELYHITSGTGLMTLGEERFEVRAGDTVYIAPGIAHCISNAEEAPLRLLCHCSPPYSDQDTELL